MARKNSCTYNKLTTEVWKGYGEIRIVDHHNKKMIVLKVDHVEDIKDRGNTYEFTDMAFAGNNYHHVRKVEDVFRPDEESEALARTQDD